MEGSEERYLADLVTLSRSYQEEAKRRSERYQAERAEHERRLKEIDSEHYRAAVDMNAMYRARVAQAARIRMSQAEADGEHTGGIESASKAMDALIGGACHDRFDFNVSTASKVTGRSASISSFMRRSISFSCLRSGFCCST